MSEESPAPTANLPETVQFLTGIGCGEPEHLAIHNETDGMLVRTVEPDAIEHGVRQLARYQGTHNCYYHANPIGHGVRNKKAKRDQVLFVRMLHVDVDSRDALERILAYALPPTVIIDTGGRFQCIWLLKAPLYDIPRAEALSKRIAADLGGDHCFTVDHLLRLPGTVNALNAKKRTAGRKPTRAFMLAEHTDFNRRYTIEECERALGLGLPALSAGNEGGPAPIVMHTAESLPIEVSQQTLDLIRMGDDAERPMGTKGARYPSRSEAIYRAACDLARAGADEGIIAGVLLHPANGISLSVREKRDPENMPAAKRCGRCRRWEPNGRKSVAARSRRAPSTIPWSGSSGLN